MRENPEKLTPAQRKALVWIQDHEPVGAFPCDGAAPSIRFVQKMERLGLVETAGVEAGRWGFTRFRVTELARDRLSHSSKSPSISPAQEPEA